GCGQWTKRRSRIAEEQVCFFIGKTASALYSVIILAGPGHLYTQTVHSLQHAIRIVRLQQMADLCSALSQGSQQQRAVGDAFGTRELHNALRAGNGLEIKKFHCEPLLLTGCKHHPESEQEYVRRMITAQE